MGRTGVRELAKAKSEAKRQEKRFEAAVAAMQGYLSNSKCKLDEIEVAYFSVKQADMLLNELEGTEYENNINDNNNN